MSDLRRNLPAYGALLRTELWSYCAALAAVSCAALAYIAIPLALRDIALQFTNLAAAFRSGQVVRTAALIGVLVILQSVFTFVQTYVLAGAGERIVGRLKARFYRSAVSLPLVTLVRARLGDIASRFGSDVVAIQDGVTDALTGLVQHGVFATGALIALLVLDWRLTLIAFAGLVVVGTITSTAMRFATRALAKIRRSRGETLAVLVESIANAPIIQAFVREDYMSARFEQMLGETYRQIRRQTLIASLVSPATAFVFIAMIGGILIAGLRQIADGTLSTPSLIAYITYCAMLGSSTAQIGQHIGRVRQSVAALGEYRTFVEHLESDSPRRLPGVTIARGSLRFDRLSFRYPGAEHDALSEISLGVEPGETVAVIGPSGAGKSTLANILVRALEPTGGRIVIDGLDVTQANLRSLREQIGYVPQEPFLFAGTLRENILFGKLDAGPAEFDRAVRAANVAEFAETLPDGWDTYVGERGATLSRGQCQRIAIARVFLKDPAIVVLDEATASLDLENEELIRDAVDRLCAGRTVVVIAHRGSVLRHVDRVAVLTDGRLAAFGSPQHVATAFPAYADLLAPAPHLDVPAVLRASQGARMDVREAPDTASSSC